MWITVCKCRNYEEMKKWMIHQEDPSCKTPPMCADCIDNSVNGGRPCAITFDPSNYYYGKWTCKPELAIRRMCKRVARERRIENYKRNYAERQDSLRDSRSLSRALDSMTVTWETFAMDITAAALKRFGDEIRQRQKKELVTPLDGEEAEEE